MEEKCRLNKFHGTVRVFSRDVVLGGKLLLWGEKMRRISKKQTKFLLFGGEIQNLGGEISPPKGPEKNTGYSNVE